LKMAIKLYYYYFLCTSNQVFMNESSHAHITCYLCIMANKYDDFE